MNNLDTIPRSEKWRSWLVLFLRWLLGGIAGFGISAWIYFYIDVAPPSRLLVPLWASLSGYKYLADIYNISLYPSFIVDIFDPYSIRDIWDINPSGPLWIIVGALLASGRKKQITIGVVLLTIGLIVGLLASFLTFYIVLS